MGSERDDVGKVERERNLDLFDARLARHVFRSRCALYRGWDTAAALDEVLEESGMIWLCLLYFAPPIGAMFVKPQCQIYGRVWLFNLVSLFFWPILMCMMPLRTN